MVGKRVDVRHPTVVAWLVDADGAQAALDESDTLDDDAPTRAAPTTGGDRDEMRRLLLRRRRAEAERIESRNARDAERLISREFVQQHVFGYLDGLNRRLLADVPKSAAARINVTTTLEERERVISTEISAQIRDAKRRTIVALAACKTGDNPPDVVESQPEESTEDDVRSAVFRALRSELGGLAGELVERQWKQVARLGAGERFEPAVFERIVAVRSQIDEESRRLALVMLEAMLNRVHLSLMNNVEHGDERPTKKGKKDAV